MKTHSKEPRIPLSLAAPALVYARFSMEAVFIDVKFDRATLRGALPVDSEGFDNMWGAWIRSYTYYTFLIASTHFKEWGKGIIYMLYSILYKILIT